MMTLNEPVWVRADLVLAIHLRQLAEHGGSGGIRDPGLLDAALTRPRHLLAYPQPSPDLPTLAAAYDVEIVQHHPFIDGNKRVALVVARFFLRLNGLDRVASQQEKYLAIIRLAEGSSSVESSRTGCSGTRRRPAKETKTAGVDSRLRCWECPGVLISAGAAATGFSPRKQPGE